MLKHVRALWGPYWPVPSLLTVYALIMWAIGDLRPEHIVFAVLCLIFGYLGPGTKSFLVDVSPYLFVATGYDLVRYARPLFVTAERVLACELRSLELALFSVAPGVTAQDWFARHHHPALDLYFAVPYTVFIYVAFLYAAYLYFVDRPRMRHYLWSFALANFISFAIWMILPAAPPWYVRAHGCVIDMNAAPSPAALVRVDALLGIDYFHTFYSRAASVYGAVPSMHCAYPLIGLLTARKVATVWSWPLHVIYVLSMFVASVYLDHHWVFDGILGWLVALVAVVVTRWALIRVGLMPTPARGTLSAFAAQP